MDININRVKAFLDSFLNKAYPGYVCGICRINSEPYIIKDGFTSFENKKKKVSRDTYYDLASLTKVVGTTPLACRFIDKGLLSLNDTVGKFFKTEYYNDTTIQNLMTHTGGFISEIRLWDKIENPRRALDFILNQKKSYERETKVEYSCMGYIVLGKILEKVGGASLDVLCREEVFNPLNMEYISFNPPSTNSFAATEIPQGSNSPLIGVVHDENARFLNGISGNAGLFSPIDDLISFTNMLLNEGEGFLSKKLFFKLTHKTNDNKDQPRALGFNLPNSIDGSFFGTNVSKEAFGHTGFTGTSIVVDPQKEVGVVLLTNRVYPTRENKILLNIRGEIHDLIFN